MSTLTHVLVVPAEGASPWTRRRMGPLVGERREQRLRWGPLTTAPTWSPDGSRLYFAGGDQGTVGVYTAPAAGGEVQAIVTGDRVVDGYSVAGDRLVFLAAEMLNPGDLYTASLDGSNESRLTHVNEEFLSGYTLSTPEEVRFESTEGTTVHGWALKPAGYTEGRTYPLVLEVHGGPHTAYGHAFFHDFQMLAARGYGVLFTNPRGSTGYGQDFTACIVKQWGERDYQDVSAAADWAAAQPWVDAERMAIAGGSYGGFMTTWVAGHTDRFKAAAAQRSCTNWSSFYGTSDIGPWFCEWMVGGNPWDNPEGYAKHSPITYVPNIRTPFLVVHSEEDHRCPVEQSEQLFVGLRRYGCETEFIRFPQESHGLTRGGKPKRRIEHMERIASWFDRYLKPGEEAAPK
ncbi:MAG: S9 family peptidase [Chloroflexia bacterium]